MLGLKAEPARKEGWKAKTIPLIIRDGPDCEIFFKDLIIDVCFLQKPELEKETFGSRLHKSGYVTFYAGKYLNEYGSNQVRRVGVRCCLTRYFYFKRSQ